MCARDEADVQELHARTDRDERSYVLSVSLKIHRCDMLMEHNKQFPKVLRNARSHWVQTRNEKSRKIEVLGSGGVFYVAVKSQKSVCFPSLGLKGEGGLG